jgi:hypothetical protein
MAAMNTNTAEEAVRRMNLERPDIADLREGALVSCKIEDIRYWRDLIVQLDRKVDEMGQEMVTLSDLLADACNRND